MVAFLRKKEMVDVASLFRSWEIKTRNQVVNLCVIIYMEVFASPCTINSAGVKPVRFTHSMNQQRSGIWQNPRSK